MVVSRCSTSFRNNVALRLGGWGFHQRVYNKRALREFKQINGNAKKLVKPRVVSITANFSLPCVRLDRWCIEEEGDPELSDILADALALQWRFGFPSTPAGFDKLTHGQHPYPAGMQPATAAILLRCLPGRVLLDPFMGGGTTVIHTSTHHTH